MTGKLWPFALTALIAGAAHAFAAPAEIDVTDNHGRPLPDAVVELVPAHSAADNDARRPPLEGIIDQRRETFLPLVTVIRQGGHVVFTNNDTTMHQVYSFSPIKQFAFELDEGQRSQPVVFDKPGVAAIGCNIHDRMITYVYVAAEPWAAISDGTGRLNFADVPAGTYHGRIWHPQLSPGTASPSFTLTVSAAGGKTAVTLPVSAVNPAAKKPMHMQMY